MPKDKARWASFDFRAIYDLEYTVNEFGLESRKSKIIFITYSPDSNTNMQEKNTILFNKNTLKKTIFAK